MKFIKFLYLILLALSCAGNLHAALKIPAIFGNNMMLQQRTTVSIWGWASPDSRINISVSWNSESYSTIADAAGKWKIAIQTPEASKQSRSITIENEGGNVVFSNVLIGEVWLCSGQSNMEMPMTGFSKPVEGGLEAIDSSQNPNIRLFTVKKTSTLLPQEDCSGKWVQANPGPVSLFSATGYFFGRLLYEYLDIPVGLINVSYAGSSIEAWMPAESLKEFPQKKIPQSESEIKSAYMDPTLLYNGMMHPVVGYGIKGVIWYQGEANRSEPDLYIKLFERMTLDWRNLWGTGDFPVYYAQLAPYTTPSVNSAFFREAQAKCMKIIPNTGMAVLMDSESPQDIHPVKKRIAGERLAYWALTKDYGIEGITYRSPELSGFRVEGSKAILTFDIVNNQELTSFGKELHEFTVSGSDKVFYPAEATIEGHKIYVSSPKVEKPVAVRYCFKDASGGEVFTADGYPLSSFRTDDGTDWNTSGIKSETEYEELKALSFTKDGKLSFFAENQTNELTIELFDVQGKMLSEKRLQAVSPGIHTIPLEIHAQGVYIVSLNAGREKIIRKIII